MPKVEFHFDFGSPNAYLSHLVIPQIETRTGVKFEYVPVLLGGVFKATNNRSPAETNAGIKNKGEYGKLEMQRFITKHGLTFAFNPNFPVNTLMMMRGAVAARQLGIFAPYVDHMYRFMWAEPRKMDDPAVVTATWKECGFDAEKLVGADPGPGGERQAGRQHAKIRRARLFRVADLLRRRRNLLWQGSPARGRRDDPRNQGGVNSA